MTKLIWGKPSDRFFEAGVDRGVLYLLNQEGVAWDGLTSVNEMPDGGTVTSYYVDGNKYAQVVSNTDFKATLGAISYPMEFLVCSGIRGIQNGLFATEQPRVPFHFSYRTQIGNDHDGLDFAYKIHLVYNAVASPSSTNYATRGSTLTPLSFSWGISTVPPKVSGVKPTAHFVIDSRYTPVYVLRAVEDILYGSESTAARMPSAEELVELFTSNGPEIRRNVISDTNLLNQADMFAPGTDYRDWTTGASKYRFTQIDVGLLIHTMTDDYSYQHLAQYKGLQSAENELWKGVVTIEAPEGGYDWQSVGATIIYMDDPLGQNGQQFRSERVDIRAGETVTLTIDTPVGTQKTGTGNVRINVFGTGYEPNGASLLLKKAHLELASTFTGEPFDGDTPDAPPVFYEWVGTPGDSQSVARSWL